MKMSPFKKFMFMFALSLSTVAIMANMVLVPAVASLYEVFGEHASIVNYIVSGPMLIMTFTTLLSPKLMQRFSSKTLIVAAFAVFTVASVFGAAVENIYYIAFMRTLVGTSMGIIYCCNVAILSKVFADEKTRSYMMGVYNAGSAIVGAILGVVAGMFATTSWTSVFKVYWISVPILVILFLSLPKTQAEEETEKEESAATKVKLFNGRFILLCLNFLFLNMVYCIVSYQVSIYVLETGIGNESLAGILSSLGTVGSALISVIFGLIYGKLKHNSLIVSIVLVAVCYAVLYSFPTVVTALIVCTVIGGAYGLGMNCAMLEATLFVDPSRISSGISVISLAMSIGVFASTYLASLLQSIMGTSSLKGIMPVLIGICCVMLLAELIYKAKTKNDMNAEA